MHACRFCASHRGNPPSDCLDHHPDLTADPRLPDDTRLWAALIRAGGGVWGGCVYDVDRILAAFDRPDRDKAPVGIRRPRTGRPPPEQLTIRELEILELLEQRLFDKEIAAKLHISASTVNTHCKNIYQKLGVGNRRRAVASAIELGILDGDQE